MPALRIAIIPNALEAMQISHKGKETLLDLACQNICAQNIAHLEFGFASAMQCSLWVSGTPAAIAALRTYLDRRHLSYEQYEDNRPPEENPLTKQQE